MVAQKRPKSGPKAAHKQPKSGPKAALKWPKSGRKWPEFEIFWPKINPWKFSAARALLVPKPQAQNPIHTMKKVVQPSPKFSNISTSYKILRFTM